MNVPHHANPTRAYVMLNSYCVEYPAYNRSDMQIEEFAF